MLEKISTFPRQHLACIHDEKSEGEIKSEHGFREVQFKCRRMNHICLFVYAVFTLIVLIIRKDFLNRKTYLNSPV